LPLVSRRRITQAIERSASLGIAMVIAPAGYGKTEALEDAFGSIACWVDTSSASGGIDGIARAIVTAVIPAAEKSLAQVLRRQTMDDRDAYVAAWLAKRLRNIDEPILLDDFQRINADPAVLAFVVSLIEATVPHTRWAIACRETPELPFGTWIASNFMTLPTIESDLAFTIEDARSLAVATNVRIEDASLAAIVEDAEGWPLVVRLALGAWERAPALPPVRIRTREVLFQFLEAQVWSKARPEDRRLLVAAAVTPFARPELLEAAGFVEPGRALDALAHRLPLLRRTADDEYRLHELFREFVLERDDDPKQRNELVALLANAYADIGYPAEALDTAIRGNAQSLVVALLEASGVQLIDDGRRGVVARALASLPPLYRGQPVALAIRGYLRAAEGNTSVAEADLRAVPKEQLAHALAAEITLKQANLAMVRGDITTSLSDVQPYLEDDDDRIRAEALVQASALHAMLGQSAAAHKMLSTVFDLLDGIPIDVRARLYVAIAYTQTYLHEYSRAENNALMAVEFATQNENLAMLQSAYSRLYVIAMSLHPDISVASGYADRWLAVAREGGERANLAFALITAIGLSAERGRYDEYRGLLDEFRRLRFPLPPRHDVPLRWARALVDVAQGRVRDAAQMMSQVPLTDENSESAAFVRSFSGLLWAMDGDEERAAELLTAPPLQLADGAYHEDQYDLYATAYRALGWWTIGRAKMAQRALRAERPDTPERDRSIISVIRTICFSPFATMTQHKLDLLTAPLLALDLSGHVSFMQAAFTPQSAAHLTRSELDILKALRGGGSTMEIAARLGRSPRTVDWHIDAVCRKIGCSGRAAALAFAVDHGWVD
jgi:ATP/maltotriose-dependent transcriptional regulator MalT